MTDQLVNETAIRYPLSGQILGMVAGFLQLKGFLREDWAGASYKTVQRLFQGERVERRDEIVRALVDAVVPAEAMMPDLIAPGISLRDWVFDVLLVTFTNWDRFVGELNASSKPLVSRRLAPYPYLRLAILDCAIRWGAHRSLEGKDPKGDLDTGFLDADILRKSMDVHRGELTLDQLAEKVGVSRNTLDSWRRGRSSPTNNRHIERLARALNRGDAQQGRALEVRLRVVAAASSCRRFLVEQMGKDRVGDFIETFRKVVRIVHRYLQFAPVDVTRESLRDVVWRGAHAGIGGAICSHLAEHAPFAPEAQADFMVLPADWSPRLAYWAQQIGGLMSAPMLLTKLFPRELNVSADLIAELAPAVESHVFDMSRFDWTPPPGGQWVRIKNSPMAAAWARSEQAERAWSSGDIDVAIEHSRRATILAPDRSEFHYALGAKLGMLAARGKADLFDEALMECRLSAQLAPSDRGPVVEIAIILSNRGELSEAEVAFAVAEPIASDWSHYHRARGINYLWMERWNDAERCFRRVVEMEPTDAPARCHLAAALAHQGNAREVEQVVRMIAFLGGPATVDLDFWCSAVPSKPFEQPQ
jgi:Flp pilus assembly protein TadD/transcriptional regulator with XRE-family HTH domain